MKSKLFHAILTKRINSYNSGHKLLTVLFTILLNIFFVCDIPKEAKIDRSVVFCHSGFCCVINPTTQIGAGTIIQHGVTIGEIKHGDTVTVGENVYIGAKATILGNIRIGNNAKIGACALVLQDVPDGCTAVGVPARIFEH